LETQVAYQHIKDEIPAAAADLEVLDFTGVPMRELRKRVAVLPNRTAIVYTAIYSDGEGTIYAPVEALARVAEVANRPIVISVETFLGRGGVGGMIMTTAALGEDAARLALRVLNGENASTIPVTEGNAVRPIFDWRQMLRWGVRESRLPTGSEIRFRPPTAWEQYRWQIVFLAAALLIQANLIVVLLYEHRRRQTAEAESLIRFNELAHVNRVVTAGELTASIAHEINQPLAAMVANANAGLRFLAGAAPGFDGARAALECIVRDGHRAGEVVGNVRAMFKKDNEEKTALDLNALIQDVLALLQGELKARAIIVKTGLSSSLPYVLGHSSQLQQVISNLVRNAADAMEPVSVRARVLNVKSESCDQDGILLSIEDSWPGIDPKNIDRIFESFYTTKPDGMGMGLSICRSIVEAHGGRIWALPGPDHGAVFNVELAAFSPGGRQ
jgi:signal transduction histidine kinase